MFRRELGDGERARITTPGRVIFNRASIERALDERGRRASMPTDYEWVNRTLTKREIGDFI